MIAEVMSERLVIEDQDGHRLMSFLGHLVLPAAGTVTDICLLTGPWRRDDPTDGARSP
jgi:hypothetical protein